MKSTKKIGLFGIVFFVLSGLIGIDGLTPLAGMGPSLYGWWLLTTVLFAIPYVLIVCELSAAFPGEGGIYEWTLRGMGSKNAARVSWYYWINVPFWIPSVYLICSGIFAELFMPDMGVWGMVGIAIVMVWASIFISNASLNIGTVVNLIGGIAKVSILIALAVGGYLLSMTNPLPVAQITLETIQPSFGDAMKYAPTLIYMTVGFEMIACLGSNIDKPEKNLPLGILISFGIILVLYWLATSSMIFAIPQQELSLIGGIVQAFQRLFGDGFFGQACVVFLSLLAAVGLFTAIIPWIMAASRAACEASKAQEMPAVFSIENASGAPFGSNVLIGVVATLALIINGMIAGDADNLFWSLFSFSGFLLFATYFFLLISFVRLRIIEPDQHRPFRIPGGTRVAMLIALIPAVILALASLLFVFPELLSGEINWNYSSPCLIAIVLSFVFIEFNVAEPFTDQQAVTGMPAS